MSEKLLKGGPFDGTPVTDEEDILPTVLRYTLDGEPWYPTRYQFANTFPRNIVRQSYRKQEDKYFHWEWAYQEHDEES